MTEPTKQEPVFNISITNSAAKRLSNLKSHYKFTTAKEVIAMSLELLNAVKNAKKIVVTETDGATKEIHISSSPKKGD